MQLELKDGPEGVTMSMEQLLSCHDLIASIVAALEARDPHTADHSMRVAEMTEAICGYLQLSAMETTVYHIAAHLHDLGKIGIEDYVLRKEGPLSRLEWEEMKTHPAIGYLILKRINFFEEIAVIVRSHHERWDGNGYPDALFGETIPFGSRIIAIADSVDAMLSDRPYRKGMSSKECRQQVEENINKMYDQKIAEAVLTNWEDFLESRKKVLEADTAT